MTQTGDAVAPTSMLSQRARSFVERAGPLYIDGEWVAGAEGEYLDVEDPAAGAMVTQVSAATEIDVDRAVRAARAAFDGRTAWRRMLAADRGLLMHRLADLMEANADELAELEALDAGKPWRIALEQDVALSVRHFRYFAGWPSKIEGETIPVAVPDMTVHTRKEPVGVVGQIIPWNFPLLMAAWKLAPALATGCTIVLKPAEQTPLSALRLAELIHEVGFPAGVVNVVCGHGPVAGDALASHPLVDKVAFTGSTAVGTAVAANAAREVKRVTLELGGKSPNIVLADAPLDSVVPGAFSAVYGNCGQSCSAGTRLYVERRAFDDVIGALAERAGGTRLGHGLEDTTELGPLISGKQLERVAGYLSAADQEGATVAAGGGLHPAGTNPRGHFVEPTVLVDVSDDMRVAREEIFGPVLVAMPFDDLEEVARRANDTTYGLAAGIWTRDIVKANRLANELRAGTVYINTYGYTDAAVPFGGFAKSGFGREMGHANLDAYLEVKSVWTSLAS